MHIAAAFGGTSGHFGDCIDSPCIIIGHVEAATGGLQNINRTADNLLIGLATREKHLFTGRIALKNQPDDSLVGTTYEYRLTIQRAGFLCVIISDMIRSLAGGSKSLDHDLPKSPDDWIKVADRELENIAGSYKGGVSNDAKIDHAIKATEAALKALFWKVEDLKEWPSKTVSQYKFLYKHNLEVLLDKCNRRAKLKVNPDLWASWQTLVNASVKAHRYLPSVPSNAEANEVAKSARHPDVGIVPWLKKQFYQKT